MTGESNKTLYVGNLAPSVTEDLVRILFNQLGEVITCKMFQEANSDPYCFVEYCDRVQAVNAITMMNDKILNSRKMRVDWATGQTNKTKTARVDTSKHFHVYVGELSPEIDEEALRDAFKPFGEISDCKVVKDPQTFKSRGYGFVVFVKKYDAEVSIQNMNGQWLGRKMIKARWATRKLSTTSTPEAKPNEANNLDYDDVYSQTTGTNTTVFCGGLKQDVMEETLQESFEPFGTIDKIKIFKEKGFAFIKYTCKEHACQAIVAMHNSIINGQTIRCSWGKDTGPEGNPTLPTAASPSLLEHATVVGSPIPVSAALAGTGGQAVVVNSAVAAAYANAVSGGVPLGMQQMAAAATGSPIIGGQISPYTGQVVHSPQGLASPAGMLPHGTPVAHSGQPISYLQYYSQQAAAAAVAAQQQQQQIQQQQMLAMAVNGGAPGSVSPMAYYSPGGVPSHYLPQYYSAAGTPAYQPVQPAAPPGYMWMYPSSVLPQ